MHEIDPLNAALEQAEDNNDYDSRLLKYPLGGLLAAYGGIPVLKTAARYNPMLQRKLAEMSSRANNIVEGVYGPGVSSFDKFKMFTNHIVGKNKSENMDAARLLKQAYADYTQDITKPFTAGRPIKGMVRHTRGFSGQTLDMINEVLPRLGEKPINVANIMKYGDVDFKDIVKVQKAVNSGLIHQKSIGELLAGINLDVKYARQEELGRPISVSGEKRKLSHERLKSETTRYVQGQPYDSKILIEEGYSKPVEVKAKHIFRGVHKDALPKWGFTPNDRVSYSMFFDSSNKKTLSLANTKDSQFKIAEYVVNNVKNLNNRKEVLKAVQARASQFGTSKFLMDKSSKIHSQDDFMKAAQRFLNNYYIKDNKLHINYSPNYKPNYFLGGVNTDAVLWKGGRSGKKLLYSILTTDKYDLSGPEEILGEGGIQKNRHLTVHAHGNANQFVAPKPYVSSVVKLRNAIKNNDKSEALKQAKKAGISASKRVIAEFGSKHWANRHLLALLKRIAKSPRIGALGAVAGAAMLASSAFNNKE